MQEGYLPLLKIDALELLRQDNTSLTCWGPNLVEKCCKIWGTPFLQMYLAPEGRFLPCC